MTITLGSTTLCHGQARYSDGSATGPRDLVLSEAPGVVLREYIGQDRVNPERVLCNSGTVSFGVTRTFATAEDALAYATTTVFTEAVEGQLKFGDANVFGAKSVVTARNLSVVGRTVAVNYVIQG